MTKAQTPNTSDAPSPRHSPSTSSSEVWEQVDQQLIEWGEQLDQLWSHSRDHVDLEQEKIILDLETQYNSVRDEILMMQQRVEGQHDASPSSEAQDAGALDKAKEQLADLQETASAKARDMTGQVKETIGDLSDRVRSGEALDDLKDATERMKVGAAELGDGVSRAWGELKNAFESAGNRMKENEGKKSDGS